jgi:RNA polymerase sigma factor (sigma-70 family)
LKNPKNKFLRIARFSIGRASYLQKTMSNESLMTDADVVGRVLNGERHEFTQLIHRYQDRIYGLAYHYTNHFEDARDVAQDAFIQAYRQLQTLREPVKFGPWLKQLTINECRMRHRERATRKEEALTEAHDGILVGVSESDDTDRKLALQQAMSALPEANRLTLTLFYFYSYSLEELATFLEVSTGTVMSRLRNARRQLKKE